MNDPILAPAHYTVYPVQPIEITRYLGFCLGNATKYVLRAPYKGGEEDCLKALRYLKLEKETPGSLPEKLPLYPYQRLLEFFNETPGDDLWCDIADASKLFLINLYHYAARRNQGSLPLMVDTVQDLRRILSLRDTTGQIYEGMTGLPVRGDTNE